jgi:hypothetical protein
MTQDAETRRSVQDTIRFSWLNVNAREISISPINCSGVALTYEGETYVGESLKDCVNQVLEKKDGQTPTRFVISPDTASHQP